MNPRRSAQPHGDGRPARRLGRGFASFELLYAIGILAVLIAILLPIVSLVQDSKRRGTCTDHLRQLRAAFALYAADNDSYLPKYNNQVQFTGVEGDTAHPVKNEGGQLWDSVNPYVRKPNTWYCPVDSYAGTVTHPETWQDFSKGRVNHFYTSYAYAVGLAAFDAPPVRIEKKGVLLTDNVWGCSENSWNRDPLPYSHRGRFNRVFLDGHIQSFTPTDKNCRGE